MKNKGTQRRIVIATTNITTGGLGSYLMTLVEGLKARDWDVRLLVTNERGDLYESMQKLVICYNLSDIPLSRKKVIMTSDLLNEILPDILLTNNCSLIHYGLPLLLSKIKPIAVLHSDDFRFYSVASLFSKRIFRWIAPTRKLSEECKRYIGTDLYNRIRIIPHGVESEIFLAREDNRIKDKSGTITFIGFIAENKGADLLPDILENVLQVNGSVTLNIVGYGPLKEKLEKDFRRKGILSHCRFTGIVAPNKIAQILRSTDIFLLPTRIEGFGLAIIEAMMSGAVPIITKLEGITNEIVKDGVTGMLIELNNIEKFSKTIIHLLNDRICLKEMSKAASLDAIRRFSNKIMINSYENLFNEKDDRAYQQKINKFKWFLMTIAEIKHKGIFKRVVANYISRIFSASHGNR